MERFVVVDLETTGHAVKHGDEIIEIGIVLLEGNEIVDEYTTKVKPKSKIPSFISHLTGIQEDDVKDAPYFEEVIPDIIPFFENSYFIAHHVQFDYEFLSSSLEHAGYEPLACPTIDTVELSRIMYPKAQGYKLSDITSYLGIEHFSPHRALSDAFVTAVLWQKMQEKIKTLPYVTLKKLRPFIEQLNSELDELFDQILETKRNQYDQEDLYQMSNGLAISRQESSHKELPAGDGSFQTLLNDVFHHKHYRNRGEQQQMAHTVLDAFDQQQHTVIEAGAGLGKTTAYLLPAWFKTRNNDQKIVISTSTIQLQSQIVSEAHDLFHNHLNKRAQVTLLKSPDHYLDTGRLQAWLDHYEDYDNYDFILSLAIILVWLTETKTGDIDELQLPSNGLALWKYINCEGARFNDSGSFFQQALNQAKNSQLIVVNHAFLLNDLLHKQNRIPNYDYAIIDEAHQFENIARTQASKELSYVFTVHLLQDIQKVFNDELIDQAKYYADAFFRSIYQAVHFLHGQDDLLSDTGKVQLTIDDYYLDLLMDGNIRVQLNNFLMTIERLLEKIKASKDTDTRSVLIMDYATQHLSEMIKAFQRYFDKTNTDARWIEIDQLGAKNAATLHLEPVTMAEEINRQILTQADSYVFISSTLQTNQSFQSFLERTGLKANTPCMVFKSPFNYEEQTRILIPNNIPDVSKTKQSTYTTYVADFLTKFITSVHGKVLVLFTSYEMLKLVYKHLKLLKSLDGYTIIGQGVTTGSRDKLKKMYESEDHAILLGTNSFWEGLDLKDEPFKVVCMVRLPFETPNHPFIQARSKLLDVDHNVFEDLALPIAIQRFRQAFGRIIRNEHDRGMFIILDQRIKKKNYGKKFLESLPDVPVIYDEQDKLFKRAKKWVSYYD
ncbi:ATP-dependent DNA helicase DinG [Alkalibacillus aidingensis]|uniref:ATP-dependent DNA helicase DinG n=1 Tax=Alkalibacillus aidingensis TaxID=2747607 RepID=UPI0016617F3D|nr:ATP-dependent DNA helicase DinG [Alkalibacillus aidingensis]